MQYSNFTLIETKHYSPLFKLILMLYLISSRVGRYLKNSKKLQTEGNYFKSSVLSGIRLMHLIKNWILHLYLYFHYNTRFFCQHFNVENIESFPSSSFLHFLNIFKTIISKRTSIFSLRYTISSFIIQ